MPGSQSCRHETVDGDMWPRQNSSSPAVMDLKVFFYKRERAIREGKIQMKVDTINEAKYHLKNDVGKGNLWPELSTSINWDICKENQSGILKAAWDTL